MNYHLNINFEGNDYTIEVEDLETAEILNDPQAAFNFLSVNYPHLLPGGSGISSNVINTNISATPNEICSEARTPDPMSENIWIRKKPTTRDLEATALLISLRQKMDSEFKDKKTPKSRLWQRIAEILKNSNFPLGDNAAERCRQKFANSTKSYLNYVQHQKTTGEGNTMDVPLFFDEMHSLLGSKHKVNPVHIEDSMEIENSTTKPVRQNELLELVPAEETPQSTMTQSIGDRFSRARKKIRPLPKSEAILNELKIARETRETEFQFFKSHLEKTEEQRDEFLKLFKKAIVRNDKKRKRTNSSDSE